MIVLVYCPFVLYYCITVILPMYLVLLVLPSFSPFFFFFLVKRRGWDIPIIITALCKFFTVSPLSKYKVVYVIFCKVVSVSSIQIYHNLLDFLKLTVLHFLLSPYSIFLFPHVFSILHLMISTLIYIYIYIYII